MSNSKIALEKLFYNYIDYQYNYYTLTKKHLMTTGIHFPFINYGHFSQFSQSMGGINENSQSFFLINKNNQYLNFFISKNIINFGEAFSIITEADLKRCLSSSLIDKSLYLNLRNRTSSIILFEDELIELSFLCNQKTITVPIKIYNIHEGKPLNVQILEYNNINLLIKELKKDFTIKISILNESKLRPIFEHEVLPLEKTLSHVWNIFYNLIQIEHYFKFLKKITHHFPMFPKEYLNLSFKDYKQKIINLTKNDFSQLDPFDWGELLFGFQFLGDFNLHRKHRIELIKKIKHLENTNTILISKKMLK